MSKGTIKENAENYESPQTKNIVELKKVSVNLEIREETVNQGEENEFTVKKFTVDGEDYRIPDSVLKQLKEHLKENPKLEFFKVNKTGSGLKTEYTVIPIME